MDLCEARDAFTDRERGTSQKATSLVPQRGLPPPPQFYTDALSNGNTEDNLARERGFDLLNRLREHSLLQYLIVDGRQDEFCRIYDAQSWLLVQVREIEASMLLARYWLDDCWNKHTEELASSEHRAVWQRKHPRRLVDMGEPSQRIVHPIDRFLPETIRVVDVPPGQDWQYIAISYRWSPLTRPSQQLTQETRESFYRGFDSSKLPAIHRDALRVTALLGFRYLWIDSLCIIQGTSGDWHAEAPNMASIYGNAILTVAFDGETDMPGATENAGKPEQPWLPPHEIRESSLLQQSAEASATKPFLSGGPIPEAYRCHREATSAWLEATGNLPSRPEGELDRRGWTFQERLLSHRVLTITRRGLSWGCGRLNAEDSRPVGLVGDFSPYFRDSDERKAKELLLRPDATRNHGRAEFDLPLPPDATGGPDKVEFYHLWRRILQSYSARQFTYPTDRLIAINGVVQVLENALQDRCFLGIWRGDILRSLIWFNRPDSPAATPHPSTQFLAQSNEAPSWCWASVPEAIIHGLSAFSANRNDRDSPMMRNDHSREHLTYYATVNGIQADANPDNLAAALGGQLSYQGRLQIKGALAKVSMDFLLSLGAHEYCRIIMDARPERSLFRLHSRLSTSARRRASPTPLGADVFLLPLLRGGNTDLEPSQVQYSLILLRVSAPPAWAAADGEGDDVEESNASSSDEGSSRASLRGRLVFRRVGLLAISLGAPKTFCLNDSKICRDWTCALRQARRSGRDGPRKHMGRTRLVTII